MKLHCVYIILLVMILAACQAPRTTMPASVLPSSDTSIVTTSTPTSNIFTQIPEGLDTPFIQTRTPTTTLLPTPITLTSNPILLEAQQLAQKYDAFLQQGPGWVHIIKEETSRHAPGQVFPPSYLKSEEWFEVDAKGYVTHSVHTDYNDAGQIIQQAATVGDYGVNFTTGESGYNNAPPYRISINILTDFLSRANQNDGSQLSHEETSCDDGRNCLLITGWEIFSSPVQNPGETQAFYGAGERVWTDKETGQLVKRQTYWLLEDSSELISSTSNYSLVEKVESPPQEILDILAHIILP